jgi:hypothetical protein
MDAHLLAYYIGITVVFASHLAMALFPKKKLVSMPMHVYGNLVAAMLIAYYFMHKEGYIQF